MPSRYEQEAIDLARKFYCDYGGNGAQIEQAMRRAGYHSWSKQNLYDRGDKLGWITRFGFEKSLKLALDAKINAVSSEDERRYRAVVQLADHYQSLALGGDDKAVDKFIKLTDQQIALRSKLDLSSASFESFVEAFEQIVMWAKEVDTDLAKLFYRRKDEFIERASLHYGKRDLD